MIRTSFILFAFLIFFGGCGSDSASSANGQGGSLAQFSIANNHLYTVDAGIMNILDLSDPSHPRSVNKIRIAFDVETIFAYGNMLYIGGNMGMYVYEISDPAQPNYIGGFSHATSCDPVVVSNGVAYVTLSSGTGCRFDDTLNQLDVIDVREPENPILIKSISMFHPGGLGIDGDRLFVCDGEAGLKVFDVNVSDTNATREVTLALIDTLDIEVCYDVIAYNGILIVSAGEGIRQFDYSQIPLQEKTAIQ